MSCAGLAAFLSALEKIEMTTQYSKISTTILVVRTNFLSLHLLFSSQVDVIWDKESMVKIRVATRAESPLNPSTECGWYYT